MSINIFYENVSILIAWIDWVKRTYNNVVFSTFKHCTCIVFIPVCLIYDVANVWNKRSFIQSTLFRTFGARIQWYREADTAKCDHCPFGK